MTLSQKLLGVYLFVKDWIDREPVQARAIFVASAGLAARFGVRLDAEWVLALVGLLGAVATRGARRRVTPERRARERVSDAIAATNVKHAAHASVMGMTTVHTSNPLYTTVPKTSVKKPAKKKAPREAGQTWVPFLLGVVCAVLVLALIGRIVL